jgi:hypothetical protein
MKFSRYLNTQKNNQKHFDLKLSSLCFFEDVHLFILQMPYYYYLLM